MELLVSLGDLSLDVSAVGIKSAKAHRMTRFKRLNWLYVFWIGWSLFLVATFLAGLGQNNTTYGTLLEIVYGFLAVTAIQLVVKEVDAGRKYVFLSFAVLSVTGGLAWPMYDRLMHIPLSKWYPNLYFYLYQYSGIHYFFWLTVIVFCLIICGSSKSYVRWRYVVGFMISAAICLLFYFPYLNDSRYILKNPDVVDYRLVEKAVDAMRQAGNSTIDVASVSKQVELFSFLPSGAKVELSRSQNEARIAHLLIYLRNHWLEGLVYAPLFRLHACYGFLLSFILVLSSVWWYVTGPPMSAYLEKIAWLLVPYSLLEGFHHLAFVSLTDWESHESIAAIGVYFSVGLLIGLSGLFGLRLRFIQTVEGNYYEHRLLSDSSRITRWRDAFDNWVLRQFMNPGELDRRFLTQRKTEE
jgi:hypothetical protein